MELGGHAPLIIFEDADLDEAVEGAMANKYRNSGQVCVSANRIFVHENIYDEFAKKFSDKSVALKVSDGRRWCSNWTAYYNVSSRKSSKSCRRCRK